MFRERKRRFTHLSPKPVTTTIGPVDAGKTKPATPTPVRVQSVDKEWEADCANPVRRVCFFFALGAIFIRFSVIHEALAVLTNTNFYLLYIVMPPALFGVIATGGFRRTLRAHTSRFWMLFLTWLCIATAFSSWKGGSFANVMAYAKSEIVMLFVIAGLVMTWNECKLVLYTLGFAYMTDLGIGRVFMKDDIDRIDLAMGGSTIGNANDFAAHLILMMSFLLFLVMAPKIPTIIRLVCFPAIAVGFFLIFSTGSRGALLALLLGLMFSFVMGSTKFRLLVAVTVPLAIVAIFPLLPHAALDRLGTMISSSSDETIRGDAEGSSEMRRELLKKSLIYTIQHPLFGVGPGQFSSFEGGESSQGGKRGMWHETHNTFTQVSSECGIPALGFFLAAIVSAFRMILKINKLSRGNPVLADIRAGTFSLMLGIIGFMASAFFLNFAYRFYEPALCGLCIAMASAAQHEINRRQATTTVVSFQPPATLAQRAFQPGTNPAPVFSNR